MSLLRQQQVLTRYQTGSVPYRQIRCSKRAGMGAALLGPGGLNCSSSSSSSSLSSSKSPRPPANGLVCAAFVGQNNPLAGEYHSTDFDWAEHALQTAELVEQQWAAAPAAVRQAAQMDALGRPLSAVDQLLLSLQHNNTMNNSSSSSSRGVIANGNGTGGTCTAPSNITNSSSCHQELVETRHGLSSLHLGHQAATALASLPGIQRQQQRQQEATAVQAPAAAGAATQQQAPAAATLTASENEWEVFYRAHPSARFYKERRYLLLEFPCLAPPAALQHVVEIGAGCGSSILPVLRAQPNARATVCDVSSTCLQQLRDAMQLLRLSPERCTSFVADGTDPQLSQQLSGCAADVALIMFTLSAVQPEGMLAMMKNARASLRPGGQLCIRDHALYDMVQLRIPAEQCIGRHLYRRGDDTLAYFFTTEELSGLAAAAELQVVECEYVCVINRNRKSGQELRRAFVHGVFKRPGHSSS